MLEGLHPSKSRLGPPPEAGLPLLEKPKDPKEAVGEANPAELEEVVRAVMKEIRGKQPKKGEGPKAGNGNGEH